jgi:phage repressor protein C with HTH and peptisase S24 domain
MDVREALQKLIDDRNEDYASLSRLLGRNAAYMQQFIKRGVPRRLAEDDRRLLARYFGVSEELLGGPPRDQRLREDDMIPVPRLEVSAAAGAGAINEQERARSHFAFDVKWLRNIGAGDIQRLSVIRVQGDSMAPTLADGDEILVDGSDAQERLRDGIYVLRVDDALVVKRIALNPVSRRISIKSDNGAYPSWPECELGAVDLVGRVVWAARRIV